MTYEIKRDIEVYFKSGWTDTPIQYEGQEFSYNNIDEWVSLVYNPVLNERVGFDGTTIGRIRQLGIQKIFCYAKNPTKAYILADEVKAFINGAELNGIVFDIGQDRTATDLENGYFEVLVEVNLVKYN